MCVFVVFSCSENISMVVLLLFCSEGDNVPDAFTLVNHLNDWLHLLDKPVSDCVCVCVFPLISHNIKPTCVILYNEVHALHLSVV